ncbi:MAG: hypothetical protein RIT22_1919 [Bacteroidota bacterium]|jgi:hypothetical protein
MKRILCAYCIITLYSCQVTETIHLNPDGSGSILVEELRDEQSYQLIAGENYSKEEKFEDTTYVFQDYAQKYGETFAKLTPFEKSVYEKHFPVEVKIKKSSYEKEFRTQLSQQFKTILDVADLYKTENYADNIQNNYALSAEEHYYSVAFSFDGTRFNRIVKITDPVELKKQQDELANVKERIATFPLKQSFELRYYFPKPIQSVSNTKAVISADKKSLVVTFSLIEVVTNPELANLEVVLE